MIKNNGDLLITGNIRGDAIQREKLIEIEQNFNPEILFRSLVGSYIGGFNSIEVRSNGRISGTIRRMIRDFSDRMIGLEPVEESDDSILFRDLFNPLEMPFEQSFKRIYNITRGMHVDLKEALIYGDLHLALDVIERDREIDRLFWLIARQTNIILLIPQNSNRKIPPVAQVIQYYNTANIIERIADHAVIIATCIQNLNKSWVNEGIVLAVSAALQEALQTLDQSINVFLSTDLTKANRIIESICLHEETFHRINSDILHLPTDTALTIRKMSDSIRRVAEYSRDIAEEVINYHIGNENDKE